MELNDSTTKNYILQHYVIIKTVVIAKDGATKY